MTSKATANAVTEYVRDWISEQRATVPRPTWEAIGKRLGCTHSHAIGISKGAPVGREVEEAFALLRFGGDVSALRAAAKAWADQHDERVWAALHEAITLRGSKWSQKTVQALRRIGREWPVDRSVGAWIDDGDRIEAGEASGERVRSAGLQALRIEPAAK